MSMPPEFASKRRSSQTVEREILRVVASVQGEDSKDTFEQVRNETLYWVKNRTAGRLPKTAWDGKGFDHLVGGRTVLARSVDTERGAIWALRADDPDKTIPGRTWITEVTIGMPKRALSVMSIRLMAISSETDLTISPHVPGLVRQVASQCHLCAGRYAITEVPKYIGSDEDVNKLIDLLESSDRHLPVIVASGDDRTPDPDSPLIDTTALAVATLGLAHVVVLPAPRSYALSDTFGKALSVFHGAIRMYKCGFDRLADPYDHPLRFVRQGVNIGPDECEIEFRRLAARESLRQTKLGDDVVLFADVRSEAARREVASRESVTERLIRGTRVTAERQIRALKQEVRARKSEVEALEAQVKSTESHSKQYFLLAEQEEERAEVAEKTQQGLRAHILSLRKRLSQQQVDPDCDLEFPQIWDEFAEWCDEHLAGRLVLVPQARRGIKKAQLHDTRLAAECLLWLSSAYRIDRMQGIGDAQDVTRARVVGQDGEILSGIVNRPCGADEFPFYWQGRRLNADWHVKNGGNTRDPGRCLRIYYCYDDDTQQIVVADMPAHRRTGAT